MADDFPKPLTVKVKFPDGQIKNLPAYFNADEGVCTTSIQRGPAIFSAHPIHQNGWEFYQFIGGEYEFVARPARPDREVYENDDRYAS